MRELGRLLNTLKAINSEITTSGRYSAQTLLNAIKSVTGYDATVGRYKTPITCIEIGLQP